MPIRRLLVLVALVAGVAAPAAAQAPPTPVAIDGPRLVTYGTGVDTLTRVPAPAPVRSETTTTSATATFQVTYSGFSAQAQSAFQAAVDIWAGLVTSPVPITVNASFGAMTPPQLANSGPRLLLGAPGAPRSDTFYPVPLLNALTGIDQEPSQPDITAVFSSSISNWYFGTDGNTPSGSYDFETIVLHELAHGLGMVETFDVSGGQGQWGQTSPPRPFIYDRFVVDQAGTALIDTSVYPNPSASLATTLQSGAVYFDGPKARAVNGGNRVKLYAPSPFTPASIGHLDESTFPPGNPNSLMTPLTNTGESVHSPGSVTLCVLGDLGWTTAQDCSGAPATPDYTPLTPARILDTRTGVGGFTGPIGPGATVNPTVVGVGSVPSTGVKAVVMNVTATGASGATYITVYPSGESRPVASNLNVTPGQDVPNLVIAKVGPDGKVVAYNNAGTVHLIFDVVGWFSSSATSYTPLTPARILDTRTGTGGFTGPMGPGATVNPTVVGVGNVPATGVKAVVLNVTATQETAATYVTVYPSGESRPTASNLNAYPGQDLPNLVIAKVGPDGKVVAYNNAGGVHLIFDVVGWFSSPGTSYTALTPARILDTRTGTGGFTGPVAAGGTVNPTVVGVGNVPATGVRAVVLNVTATEATAATYLTVYPSGEARPTASNLNVYPGQDVANLVIAKVGGDGKVVAYNNAGSVQVIFDVVGWFA